MDLHTLASLTLASGQAALPDVDRAFLAAGPEFARTCELLAVYATLVEDRMPGQLGADNPFGHAGGGCGGQLVPTVTLVYARDCYPLPDDKGRLPDPADLTAWTTTYLQRCQQVLDRLAADMDAGVFGDCSTMQLGPASFTGPSSGVATMQVPLRVREP